MIGRILGTLIAAIVFKHPLMILLGFAAGWWFDYQRKTPISEGKENMPFKPSLNALQEAYQLLGVIEKSSNEEVKSAYKKLVSHYHPDKIVAQGGSEQDVKKATETVQKIQAAYQLVMQARN